MVYTDISNSYGSSSYNPAPPCPSECTKSNKQNKNDKETSFEKLQRELISLIDVGKTATSSNSSHNESWESTNETKYKLLLVSLFDIKTENVSSNIDKVLLLVKFYINNKFVPEQEGVLKQCYDHVFNHLFKKDANIDANPKPNLFFSITQPSNQSSEHTDFLPKEEVESMVNQAENFRLLEEQKQRYKNTPHIFANEGLGWGNMFNKS